MRAEFIKATYTDYEQFLTQLGRAVEHLSSLLQSKSTWDTTEAIKVYKQLRQFGVKGAEEGIKKMLFLVYSKEESTVNAVVETYEELYFSKQKTAIQKTKHLFELMNDATLTDITCIEELLKKFLNKGDVFDKEVFKQLWVSYAKIYEQRFTN